MMMLYKSPIVRNVEIENAMRFIIKKPEIAMRFLQMFRRQRNDLGVLIKPPEIAMRF